MTLEEGMRKTYELLDEYTSGGEAAADEDIAARLPDLFDIAQKRLARRARIVRLHSVERQPGVTEYPLPVPRLGICRVWRGERPCRNYTVRGDSLVIPLGDGEDWTVEYFALPATIDSSTPPAQALELCEAACQCLPFFVAGMVLSSDLVQDANIYLALYAQMVEELPETPPAAAGRVIRRV